MTHVGRLRGLPAPALLLTDLCSHCRLRGRDYQEIRSLGRQVSVTAAGAPWSPAKGWAELKGNLEWVVEEDLSARLALRSNAAPGAVLYPTSFPFQGFSSRSKAGGDQGDGAPPTCGDVVLFNASRTLVMAMRLSEVLPPRAQRTLRPAAVLWNWSPCGGACLGRPLSGVGVGSRPLPVRWWPPLKGGWLQDCP